MIGKIRSVKKYKGMCKTGKDSAWSMRGKRSRRECGRGSKRADGSREAKGSMGRREEVVGEQVGVRAGGSGEAERG